MGILRSDEMIHKKIRLPGNIESAISILDSLGNIEEDIIQFIDLTSNDIEAKKSFNPLIKRCEDVSNAIYSFHLLFKQFRVKIFTYENYHKFKHDLNVDQLLRNMKNGAYFDVLENEIAEDEKKMIDLVESYEKVKDNISIEIEKKLVFEKISSLLQAKESDSIEFLPQPRNRSNSDNNLNISIDLDDEEDTPFHSYNNSYNSLNNTLLCIIGVARAEDELKMKRMVFRTSRGRAMASFFVLNIQENIIQNKVQKKIFTIFYSSEGREVLRSKLIHICDLFNASRYNPNMSKKMSDNIRELMKSIEDKKNYFYHSEKMIIDFLKQMSGDEVKPGKINLYKLYFSKMKMIYINLNKCIHRENFIDGEVWIVKDHYSKVEQCLIARRNQSDLANGTFINLYETNLTKPTYISTNVYMKPSQDIVNTYGIPRYQEINPAYFNSVLFPFLFGIMFGDIGHGLILLILGLFLIIKSNSIKNRTESLMIHLLPYKYFILLMGFFSFYCGFLYNDFLSVPLPIFKSCYTKNYSLRSNCVYPFGIDSKWYVARNELAFFNSFKMKFSVIVGVMQMIFGIFLKGMNAMFFNDWLTFAFEFIPQFTFMLLIFGYMILMIFIKWAIDWGNDIGKAPSLITQLINLFLKMGSVNNLPLWGGKKSGVYIQETFQFTILIISLVMIPLMFLPKPLIEYYMKKNNENAIEEYEHINEEIGEVHYSYLHNKKEIRKETLMNMLITQLIETIEFVLGSISSTASYLRLWALSLAHSQLSLVFFEKAMLNTFTEGKLYYGGSLLMIVVCFFLFANITIFVLMFMDLMECFLHTLRLHWVEFQNKYFKADGYLFEPFSFKYLIRCDADNSSAE